MENCKFLEKVGCYPKRKEGESPTIFTASAIGLRFSIQSKFVSPHIRDQQAPNQIFVWGGTSETSLNL